MSDSFVTPLTIAHQAPLSLGFHRQEYWSKLSSFSGVSSHPRDWTHICVGRQILYHWTTREALVMYFSPVQSLICVQLLATPWTRVCQASLSITNSHSLLTLMPIKLVMPANHFILCWPFCKLSQHQGLFQWVSSSYQLAKVLELQHLSFQWIFKTDFL